MFQDIASLLSGCVHNKPDAGTDRGSQSGQAKRSTAACGDRNVKAGETLRQIVRCGVNAAFRAQEGRQEVALPRSLLQQANQIFSPQNDIKFKITEIRDLIGVSCPASVAQFRPLQAGLIKQLNIGRSPS